MNELPFINNPEKFISHLNQLKACRAAAKKKTPRKYTLSPSDKKAILQKTNSKCHICGGAVTLNQFEADHVEVHSSSNNNRIDNFLPACRTCNNYRWFYDPEELKWILKLGVWINSEIRKSTSFGKLAADKFILQEIRRENRRKIIRT